MASGCAINSACSASQKGDNDLLDGLFALMIRREERPYPDVPPAEPQRTRSAPPRRCAMSLSTRAAFDSWFAGYRARLRDEQVDDAQRQQRMQGVNPALVLRNWLAQRAIEQAEARRYGRAGAPACRAGRPLYRSRGRLRPPPAGLGKRLEVSCSS
ncbi:hypothetical protein LN650_13090 [Klebsiella pneumoniae subsp. pneumoniae]|nr:hypothetical protein [Klebsiella pneumoniae subsp. pneumoniae]